MTDLLIAHAMLSNIHRLHSELYAAAIELEKTDPKRYKSVADAVYFIRPTITNAYRISRQNAKRKIDP